MKNIILIALLSAAQWAVAQNAPIDFEAGGFGAGFTWATFEAPAGENNPTFSVEANVSVDGDNPSATVGKLDIEYATTAVWGSAGCETMHNGDVGPFTITEDNNFVIVQFYQVGFAAPVALKFATTEGAAFPETVVNNTVSDAWVTIAFDMSPWIGSTLPGVLDQIIVFPSYAPRATGHVVYFDNISFSPDGVVNVNELPESSFRTFPNPTNDSWTVESEGSPILQITVFDVTGKQVISVSPQSEYAQIDATALVAGAYTARVRTSEGVASIKLIKE